MTVSAKRSFVILLLLASASCSETAPTQPVVATTQAAVLDALSAAYCRWYSRCHSSYLPVEGMRPGVITANGGYGACLREVWWNLPARILPAASAFVVVPPMTNDSMVSIRDALNSGATALDTAHLEACVEEIDESTCTLNLSMKALPECASAFTGSVADGQPCRTSFACTPGGYCSPPGLAVECEGTCGRDWRNLLQIETAGVDQLAACLTDDWCPPGQFCSFTAGSHCQPVSSPPGELGEACGDMNGCAAELYCAPPKPDGGPAAGTCAARPGAGEACEAAVPCGAGLGCSADYQCQPLAAPGAICDTGIGCTDGTCLQQPGPTGPSTGIATCGTPDLELGSACMLVGECDPALTCDPVSRACVALPSSGPCGKTLATLEEGCDPATALCDAITHPTAPGYTPLKTAGAGCQLDSECSLADHELCLPQGVDGGSGNTCQASPRISCEMGW